MNPMLENIVDACEPVVIFIVDNWIMVLIILTTIVLFILGPLRWILNYFGVGFT